MADKNMVLNELVSYLESAAEPHSHGSPASYPRSQHGLPVYQIDGLTPVVPDESYVHPTAVLIGDVILEKVFMSARTPACAEILAVSW